MYPCSDRDGCFRHQVSACGLRLGPSGTSIESGYILDFPLAQIVMAAWTHDKIRNALQEKTGPLSILNNSWVPRICLSIWTSIVASLHRLRTLTSKVM